MPLPNPKPDPRYFLSEFVRPVFVETGSHRGDGIAHALAAGFDCIYSVDISSFAYGWCCHRFQNVRTKVHLFLDDSRTFLGRILPDFTTPSTFWLDAHWCGGDGELDGTGQEDDPEDVVLLGELEVIGAHPIKNHVLLIDDIRMFGTPPFPALDDVLVAIRAINPDYVIRYVDSNEFPGDILVATA